MSTRYKYCHCQHVATGEKWKVEFTSASVHQNVFNNEIDIEQGLTFQQAMWLVNEYNRCQSNYKQEFKYTLD